MKKQTLLGAAALTTLALAGAAHAGTLSPNAAGASTVKQNRVIATEASAASLEGTVSLALTPSNNAILPSGNAILKISLDGGATFGKAVTSAAIGNTPAGCAPTVTPSAGGGKDDSSVTFLVSNLQGCKGNTLVAPLTDAAPILIDIPVKLNGTSNVNVSTDLRTEAGTAIDGATATTFKAATASADAVNLFSFAPAFALKVVPGAAGDLKAMLPGFTTLTGTDLGTAAIDVRASTYTGLTATTPVSATDITSVKYTVKGGMTTVDLSAKVGVAVPAALATTGIVTAGGAETVAFTAAAKGTPTAIAASTYTVSADVVLGAGFNTQPTYGPASLRSIIRDGASYMVPWVASGTLATASTSNTVVRIANTGAKTGPVSLELLTSSAGTPVSTTLIPVAASIAKGGEVVLTSGQIETLVGSNFGRGDVRITVEAQPADLIVRRFVQSTVNGALSEVSLGRDAAGNEPRN